MTKVRFEVGNKWRFGPDWPGQRCCAKTRKGMPCQRGAKLPVGRCRLHGGASTGPRTAYSGADHARKEYHGETGGCQAAGRGGPAGARGIKRTRDLVRGPRSSGQEMAGLVQIRGKVSRLSRLSQYKSTTGTKNNLLKSIRKGEMSHCPNNIT